MLPNLVIIGAQKSASTYLHLWLENHPQIFFRKGESKAFEDPEYQNFEISSLNQELGPEIKIYGIKRPEYLAHAQIADRIKQHLGRPKIICILRNPSTRAISAYYHYMKYGIIPVKSPDGVLKDILDRNVKPGCGAYENTLFYGLYGLHLQKYFDVFGAENIHVAFMEEIIDNKKRQRAFDRLCDFLQVPILPISPPEEKPQASIYNLIRLRWRNIANPLIRRYDRSRGKSYGIPLHERKWFSKLIVKLILGLDARVLKKILKNNKSRITDQTKQKLVDYYVNDITKLEILIGQKLDHWKRL